MKSMTCQQLGGACDVVFQANTFEEISQLSKNHGMDMYKKSDGAHINAMNEMMELMKNPYAMNDWLKSKRKEFDELAEN